MPVQFASQLFLLLSRQWANRVSVKLKNAQSFIGIFGLDSFLVLRWWALLGRRLNLEGQIHTCIACFLAAIERGTHGRCKSLNEYNKALVTEQEMSFVSYCIVLAYSEISSRHNLD